MHNLHLLAYYGEIEKEVVFTMLLESFFQSSFSILEALIFGILIGMFLGGGGSNLYSSLRFKRVHYHKLGEHTQRALARPMKVTLFSSIVPLTLGVLGFVGLVVASVSVTGMILNRWTGVFVAICGLVALSMYLSMFMVRKRLERSRRLAGRGMEGEEQSVRSRSLPVPKEAREEE